MQGLSSKACTQVRLLDVRMRHLQTFYLFRLRCHLFHWRGWRWGWRGSQVGAHALRLGRGRRAWARHVLQGRWGRGWGRRNGRHWLWFNWSACGRKNRGKSPVHSFTLLKAGSCCVMLYNAVLCYAVLCYAMLYCTELWYVVLCCAVPCSAVPALWCAMLCSFVPWCAVP